MDFVKRLVKIIIHGVEIFRFNVYVELLKQDTRKRGRRVFSVPADAAEHVPG